MRSYTHSTKFAIDLNFQTFTLMIKYKKFLLDYIRLHEAHDSLTTCILLKLTCPLKAMCFTACPVQSLHPLSAFHPGQCRDALWPIVHPSGSV